MATLRQSVWSGSLPVTVSGACRGAGRGARGEGSPLAIARCKQTPTRLTRPADSTKLIILHSTHSTFNTEIKLNFTLLL